MEYAFGYLYTYIHTFLDINVYVYTQIFIYIYRSKILRNAEDDANLHNGETILTYNNAHYNALIDRLRINITNNYMNLKQHSPEDMLFLRI
jgi:hypothetical protein